MKRGRIAFGTRVSLAVAALLVCSCSNGSGPQVGDATTLITWGSTGIIYAYRYDNLRLIGNFLRTLGEGRDVAGQMRILYSSGCDPRVDPGLCQIAGDFAVIKPFFDMVAGLGTIEFAPPSEVSLSEYSVLIADFCRGAGGSTQTGVVATYVRDGGRALILGDNFCFPRGRGGPSSASIANTVVEPLGITFTDLDPPEREPLTIPPGERMGLLTDVTEVDIWRVVPQTITHTFAPVLQSPLGVLAARKGW